ncbi:hypothetical protein FZEAL_4421 [Fusarium zealandicum]|uniref:Peptidase A1 domain-containing protein n=1 Tax=Fusarium zealandicum TaxID=1053134 RepID=A0A8H4UMH4_9HYPO|nr:hypothetical protein FZEAL_4421 [Fusarium zealandicum]
MRTFPLLVSLAAGAAAGTVSAPFSKQKLDLASAISKRDGTLDLDAINNVTGAGYYAEFEVGTPGQKISFLLDTGSSDTWLNSDDTDYCNDDEAQAQAGYCMTTFNPDDSKTFNEVDRNGFDITYVDTRHIQGDYFEDTISIDGKTIKKQQLGLAVESVRPVGIMGLGFSANVAAKTRYATVIENMVSQGYIDRAAFSLWLNDLNSDEGTILFGGIDKKKFVGKLATLPLEREPGSRISNVTSFSVAFEGLSVNTPDGQKEVDLRDLDSDAIAILDSGSTICLLPDKQVQQIWKEFDVVNIPKVSVPFVDCAYGKSKGKDITIDFKFKGKTIAVPLSEMVIDVFKGQQDQFMGAGLDNLFADWDSICMFGITSAEGYGIESVDFALLGDTFLRSAYVVYDLANEQLGIAEANSDTGESDIVELNADDKDFPDISGVASKSKPIATDSSGTRPTVTVTAGSDASSGQSGDGDDDDNAAGHLVPAFMATLMMVLGAMVVVV